MLLFLLSVFHGGPIFHFRISHFFSLLILPLLSLSSLTSCANISSSTFQFLSHFSSVKNSFKITCICLTIIQITFQIFLCEITFSLYLALLFHLCINFPFSTNPFLASPQDTFHGSLVKFFLSSLSPILSPRFYLSSHLIVRLRSSGLRLRRATCSFAVHVKVYRRVFGRARPGSSLVYTYLAISFAENVVVLGRTDTRAIRSFAGVSPCTRQSLYRRGTTQWTASTRGFSETRKSGLAGIAGAHLLEVPRSYVPGIFFDSHPLFDSLRPLIHRCINQCIIEFSVVSTPG